ncbi:MAG: ComF family protein [Bacteroidales bacterium]|nr:ComF family protein [Bacteroidales bacterium]
MNICTRYLLDFFELFFPKLCAACSNNLLGSEDIFCSYCLYHLPKTEFHNDPENKISQLFWGRVHIENATSFLYYYKGSKYQKAIHEFKYRGKKQIGHFIGKLFGSDLKSSPFNQVDILIPVPLHFKKLKKRGFNQSEIIAMGMAESLGKPVESNLIERTVATKTQTKKSRYARWTNVEGIFNCKNTTKLQHKHVLLVDDVITTGSTLEACANAISHIKGIRISVATLAVASI